MSHEVRRWRADPFDPDLDELMHTPTRRPRAGAQPRHANPERNTMATLPTADAVRRTVRTALAATLAFATVVAGLVQAGIVDPAAAPWLATIVVVTTAITRVMAMPAVDELLRRVLGESFASGPKPPTTEPVE